MCFTMIIYKAYIFFSIPSLGKEKKIRYIGCIPKITWEKIFRTSDFPLCGSLFPSLMFPRVHNHDFNLEGKMNSQNILISLCILDIGLFLKKETLLWLPLMND